MIDDTEVSRVEPDGEDAATVEIVRTADHGSRALRAERHGGKWKLTPPAGR